MKLTQTDRLLDQTSYNPTSHKASTVPTLTRRAQIVCDSDDSLTEEIKHLNTVFIKNNYKYRFHRTQYLEYVYTRLSSYHTFNIALLFGIFLALEIVINWSL